MGATETTTATNRAHASADIAPSKVSAKQLLPPFLFRLLRSLKRRRRGIGDYLYDYRRFSKYSSTLRSKLTERQLGAMIIKEYHRLEKGIALPDPRPRFGMPGIVSLWDMVEEYERRFGAGAPTIGARSAVQAYRRYHEKIGVSLPALAGFDNPSTDTSFIAGAHEVTKEELNTAARAPFDQFIAKRFSIRDFTGETVTLESIEKAIKIAMRSPRVCNRDTTRCYVAIDENVRLQVLKHQNGNKGFGHLAGAVLIVTSDMQGFTDYSERNQCWVDGGLFAMTLVYALHAQSLGTCMLNWSASAPQDRKMRGAFNIPANESVITMIAVGHVPEKFMVATSPRASLEFFRRVIE